MTVDVVTGIVIGRPRSEVFEYAANPDHAPSWYVNIKSVEWRPLTLGSRIAFVAHFLGRRMAYTYEIVELVPEERLVMRTAEGPFPMETTYVWEALGDASTRMTLCNRGGPWDFRSCSRRSWRAPLRRANEKDLAALKERLEVA